MNSVAILWTRLLGRHCPPGVSPLRAAALPSCPSLRHATSTRQFLSKHSSNSNLPRHRWDADAVAVVSDSPYHVLHYPFGVIALCNVAELYWESSRAIGDTSHAEDVADDASYSCCSSAVRFDGARMVVAFNMKRQNIAVSNVDNAGIIARTDLRQAGPLSEAVLAGVWRICSCNARSILRQSMPTRVHRALFQVVCERTGFHRG